MKLNVLRQKKHDLYQEAKALSEKAALENRLMTDEEGRRFDAIQLKIEGLADQISREEQMVKAEMKLNPQISGSGDKKTVAPATKKDYQSLFGSASDGDFKNFDEFLNIIKSGLFDPRIQAAGMIEGTPADGGFLVPAEYSKEIHDLSLEDEIVIPRATVYPMISETLKIPAFEIGNHSENLYGGLSASWRGEASELTATQPKLRSIQLSAYKLTGYTITSNEILADGINLAQSLTKVFSKGLGWFRDRAFLKGSGSGQPRAS